MVGCQFRFQNDWTDFVVPGDGVKMYSLRPGQCDNTGATRRETRNRCGESRAGYRGGVMRLWRSDEVRRESRSRSTRIRQPGREPPRTETRAFGCTIVRVIKEEL